MAKIREIINKEGTGAAKIKDIVRIMEGGKVVLEDITTKVETIKATDMVDGVAIGVEITEGLINEWQLHVYMLYFLYCGVLWNTCGLLENVLLSC